MQQRVPWQDRFIIQRLTQNFILYSEKTPRNCIYSIRGHRVYFGLLMIKTMQRKKTCSVKAEECLSLMVKSVKSCRLVSVRHLKMSCCNIAGGFFFASAHRAPLLLPPTGSSAWMVRMWRGLRPRGSLLTEKPSLSHGKVTDSGFCLLLNNWRRPCILCVCECVWVCELSEHCHRLSDLVAQEAFTLSMSEGNRSTGAHGSDEPMKTCLFVFPFFVIASCLTYEKDASQRQKSSTTRAITLDLNFFYIFLYLMR